MSDYQETLTFNLFARPSFMEGLSRILDFASAMQIYNYSRNGEEADIKALYSDWRMVGKDIEASLSKYEQEKQKSSTANF